MNKKDLSERDICSKFIGPAVKRAGWDGMMQIREEVAFTKGRIIVRGRLITRGKQHRQGYPRHYAPGLRRRWRCTTHLPALLDVFPENHRRPGPAIRADAGGLPLAHSETIPVAFLGCRSRRHHRRTTARVR